MRALQARSKLPYWPDLDARVVQVAKQAIETHVIHLLDVGEELATSTTTAAGEPIPPRRRSSMMRSALRKASLATAVAAGAASTALVLAGPASANTTGATVQVGPAYGIQCVGGYATYDVQGYGIVQKGAGANMQLRYYGQQVMGTASQVTAYSVATGPGRPGWQGPGYYEFCARNNGSNATVFISITTN
jgi:hypothetical protein